MEQLVPVTFALPLLAAAFLAATNRIISRRAADVISIVTAAGVTAASYLLLSASTSGTIVYWFGGWLPRSGISIGIGFVVDPFSGAIATLSSVLVTAALIFSWRYFEAVGNLFHILMLVFLSAINGFVLTGDLFTLFVSFELMSVAAYALTAYKIEESSLEGALNFAVTNTMGGYLLLFGLGLLYARTGALNMAQIGQTLSSQPADGLIIVSFLLILSGLLTKAAVVPFHFWLDDAHAVAPTPACVLFSGVMVESAIYAIARIYWVVFSGPMSPHLPDIRVIFLVAAIATSILGALLCFLQRHIKRMLAFSTISHSGLMLAGLSVFDGKALAGAGIYLLGHGMIKAALFICAGILLHRTSSGDELDLRGRARHLKWTALMTVVGAIGLCGVPPFATFTGKALIDESFAHLPYHWVPILMTLTTAITAGTVLRMAGRVFFGLGPHAGEAQSGAPTEREHPETTEPHRRSALVMLLPPALLLLGALLITRLPGIHQQAASWAEVFRSRTSYSTKVLQGAVETFPHITGLISNESKAYTYAAISFLVAVTVCLFSLFGYKLPDTVRRRWRMIAIPTARVSRYLHSGHVGDYVLWQMLGIAIIGIALFFAVR